MTTKSAWPDTLLMEELIHHDSANATTTTTSAKNSWDLKKDNSVTFSIASFNILAEAYLTPRSHKNLPPSCANIVFDKKLRRKLLCDTLEKLTEVFDILCLQELDDALQDVVFERLENLGYSFVYAPRGGVPIKSSNVNADIAGDQTFMGGGNEKGQDDVRSDGCATFFCKKRWSCVKYNIVNFDDLAEENRPLLEEEEEEDSTQSSYKEHNANNFSKKKKKKSRHSPISGIIASYRRRNTALVVELQHNMSSRANHIVVANAHLYWHPGYEYVKLSQAHYLVHKVKEFVNESVTKDSQSGDDDESRRPIVLICGDMNSKPNSVVYNYFTKGMVDARLVAPWNFSYDEIQEQEELALQMEQLTMNHNTSQGTIDGCNEDLDQDPVVGVVDCGSDNGGFDNDKEDGSTCAMNKDEALSSLVNQSSALSQVNDPLLDDRSIAAIQPTTRYLLDVTLNKFSRWLRILGQDAVLETTEEEKLRTGEGKM
jgi:mRNA deadenylase, exonuclease subunit and related nucleases